uniref:Glucuronosyltransferase n=1 Tax=Acrobeloides nanus TaxID=290746 RepID=A0A914DZS4_9BILA
MKFQYFLIPILFFFTTSAYKILVYNPKFGTSHVNFNGKLADILVHAGHDVKVYAPTIDDSITTNGTKLAKVLLRSRDFEVMNHEEGQKSFWDGGNMDTMP